MSLTSIKAPTKAELESHERTRQRTEIKHDMYEIRSKIEIDSIEALHDLLRRFDNKYHSFCPNWGDRFTSYSENSGFNFQNLGLDETKANLLAMSDKLEALSLGLAPLNEKNTSAGHNINVSVNNNNENSVSINYTFDDAREKINEMTSLTDEETKLILSKIDDIEAILSSNDRKKTKWEKVKPALCWLAEKSCDVGLALLPLILKL